jgi:hypothetical protein
MPQPLRLNLEYVHLAGFVAVSDWGVFGGRTLPVRLKNLTTRARLANRHKTCCNTYLEIKVSQLPAQPGL